MSRSKKYKFLRAPSIVSDHLTISVHSSTFNAFAAAAKICLRLHSDVT